jgi:two-component system cell cycle response regulator
MSTPGNRPSSAEESDEDRLDGLRSSDVLTLDLVSALAGDRPLKKAEALLLDRRKSSLGNRFYSDVLYAVTHQHFEADIARALWQEIVRHKYEMSGALKRNIRIVVAALDYLANITGDIASTTLISEEHIADIVDVSLRDGLTGLFSHAFFYRRTEFEIKRTARYRTPLSLMMIDIDHFKAFNDRHGHQEGDAILTSVGAVIEAEARQTDICCRYGGEEFAVLLPSTQGNEALALAERVREAVAKVGLHGRRITISIGVAAATATSVHTTERLVKEADAALYEAKTSGRNRVVVRQ